MSSSGHGTEGDPTRAEQPHESEGWSAWTRAADESEAANPTRVSSPTEASHPTGSSDRIEMAEAPRTETDMPHTQWMPQSNRGGAGDRPAGGEWDPKRETWDAWATRQPVRCLQCEREAPAGTRFCPHCGSEDLKGPQRCRKCDHEVEAGDRYCPRCGSHDLRGPGEPDEAEDKDKRKKVIAGIVVAALCIAAVVIALILGSGGKHPSNVVNPQPSGTAPASTPSSSSPGTSSAPSNPTGTAPHHDTTPPTQPAKGNPAPPPPAPQKPKSSGSGSQPGGQSGTSPTTAKVSNGHVVQPNGQPYAAGQACPPVDAGIVTQDASGKSITCTQSGSSSTWEPVPTVSGAGGGG